MKILIIIYVFCLCGFLCGNAQPGFLDSTFGDSGKAAGPLVDGAYYSACLQRDGKILSAGDNGTMFQILRYLHNGTMDSSFGIDGVKVIDFKKYRYDILTGIAQLTDGKILAVGYGLLDEDVNQHDVLIARLKPDGQLDETFGENGTVSQHFDYSGNAYHMQIQPDGKILVSGDVTIEVDPFKRATMTARFLQDGSKDSSYGINGMKNYYIIVNGFNTAMLLQTDGKIMLAEKDFASPYTIIMARLNGDGSLDTNFQVHGFVETNLPNGYEYINALAQQTDGKIIAVGKGHFNISGKSGQMVVVRYNTDGSLDETFGIGGSSYIKFDGNAEANSVAIQKDGKIVLTGRIFQDDQPALSDFTLARLTQNGILDSGFASSGKQMTDWGVNAYSLTTLLQNDGKILSVGRKSILGTYAICRYDNDQVKQHPLLTKIKKWIHKHILNFEDANPNAAYYVIEKSVAGNGFQEIGSVEAKGESKPNAIQEPRNVTYSYPLPSTGNNKPGTVYYRIKAVNKDNSFAYSSPISSSDDAAVLSPSPLENLSRPFGRAGVRLYPNPAKDKIYIQSAKEVNLRLQTSVGQIIITQKIKGSGSMDISKLVAGIYYIIDVDSGERFKLVKE